MPDSTSSGIVGGAASGRVASVARRIDRRNDRNGRFESIAAARNGLDQARPVVPECPSKFADALHQRIVGDGQIGPDRGEELVLRDEAAVVLGEVSQDREGLRPKGDLAAVTKETAAIKIQDIAVELQSLCRNLLPKVGFARGHRFAFARATKQRAPASPVQSVRAASQPTAPILPS